MCALIYLLTYFQAKSIFKAYKLLMMNTKKHGFCLLMLHEFKPQHNASKTVANINRTWGDEYNVIRQYKDASRNSVV